MSKELAKKDNDIISALVIGGDLSKLNQEQKVSYYKGFCERLGLDPFTQPFKILKLQGKETLYCDRSGTQQLNKLHQVSHEVVSRELIKEVDVYQVTARATLPDGRHTDSIGAVNISGLKGDAYANAIMKAETKAKRRATLDLLGLGILDETETETIPNATVTVLAEEPKATDSQIAHIDNLIHTSTIDEDTKVRIESKIMDFTFSEAERTINYLKQHQKETLDQEFDRKIALND